MATNALTLTLHTLAVTLTADASRNRSGNPHVYRGTMEDGTRVVVFQEGGSQDWPGTMWAVALAEASAGPGVLSSKAQAYVQPGGQDGPVLERLAGTARERMLRKVVAQ